MGKPLIHAEELARLVKLQSMLPDHRSGTIYCYLLKGRDEILGHSITDDGRSGGYFVVPQTNQTQQIDYMKDQVLNIKGIYFRTYSWLYPDGYSVQYLYTLEKSFNRGFTKAYQLYDIRGQIADIERDFRLAKYSWKDDADYAMKRRGTI